MLRGGSMRNGGWREAEYTRLERERGKGTHELSVNIAADGHWTPHRLHVRFLHQNLSRLYASSHRSTEAAQGTKRTTSARWRTLSTSASHLVAQFFHISLGELLALAELRNPAIYFVFHVLQIVQENKGKSRVELKAGEEDGVSEVYRVHDHAVTANPDRCVTEVTHWSLHGAETRRRGFQLSSSAFSKIYHG